MSFDIFNIAASGVRANTELLQTAGKNIANVNTEGYVRERTEHRTNIDNQVGRAETYRLLNEFAQKQLNRDISNRAFFEQFTDEAQRVDSLFSEESNSLSTSINSLFNNVQESLNQPSSTVTRSLFFSDAENFVAQLDRLSGIVFDQKTIVNDQLEIYAEEANNLIEKISTLNTQITAIHGATDKSGASAIFNERDQAIRDLSELIDIETLDGPEGEKLVFMGTGEALVMENGTFNVFSLNGDPDPNFKELRLDVTRGTANAVDIDINKLKGKIGGLVAYRDDILVPAQNQLGQIALSLGDAFNQQNRLGMNANGELGGDIFTLPTVGAFGYAANTGTADVTATLEPGQGSAIPATDFRVTFTSATTVEIQAVDNKGNLIGTPSTANVVAGVIDSTTITGGESFGLSLNVTGAAAAGDQFAVKLNSAAASNLSLATERPEDLALASPIRTASDINNISDANISAGVVTNTGAGSNFSGSPPNLTNGPITLVKTANPDEYTITDGSGTVTFTVTPPSENMLAQAGAPFNAYGFDFNIEGIPATGDTFTLEFNTGGFDDNRNGLLMADLQNTQLVRQNVITTPNANNLKTFNQAFAGLVTDIGVITNQAQTNGQAFMALEEQSEAWYESLSGVNLDEEAANLLRFQQSYAASAQVLSAAKAVFDTLLSAAR